MTIWNWFSESLNSFEREQDEPRIEMARIHNEFFEYSETDPYEMLRLIRKGSQLAKELDEPWWEYFYEVWTAICYLHHIEDLKSGLRQSLYVVNEGSKASLSSHPWRIAATNMLVSSYLKIDAIGYAAPLRKCFQSLDKEIPKCASEHRFVLLHHEVQFRIEIGNLRQAEKIALRAIALVESWDHLGNWYLVRFALFLCWIAHQKKNFDEMLDYAQQATRWVDNNDKNKQNHLAEALAWQAIAARLRGDEKEARSLFRSSRSRSSRLKIEPSPGHYEALSYFHEAAGDFDKAIEIRDRQLLGLANKGHFGQECDVLLKRGELMARLGKFSEADVAPILKALDLVKNPAPYQKRLKKILKS